MPCANLLEMYHDPTRVCGQLGLFQQQRLAPGKVAALKAGVWLVLSRFRTGLPSIAHSAVVLGARVEVLCNALGQA